MKSEGSEFDKLDNGTLTHVLSMLNTCEDLVNAACVCRLWRDCAKDERPWRQLCTKYYPEAGNFEIVYLNPSSPLEKSHDIRQLGYPETALSLYAVFLGKLRAPPIETSCVFEPLYASSTDNLPDESIVQTLYQSPLIGGMHFSYWSSTGEIRTDVPETLTYRLVSDLCVVHEVKIRPFQAIFQPGDPIYSSQMVRFRFGYSHSMPPPGSGFFYCLSSKQRILNKGDYIWTYESPAFPMAQEDTFQTFKLPRPILCIGGIFQIEFLGRVQEQQVDGLYYICVSHVHVGGSPVFNFELEDIGEGGDKYSFRHVLKQGMCPSRWKPLDRAFQPPAWYKLNRHLFQVMSRNLHGAGLLSANVDIEKMELEEEEDQM